MSQDVITDAVVAAALEVFHSHGPGALLVDDPRPGELESSAWSGSPSHLQSVAQVLEQVSSGDTESLVVRTYGGAGDQGRH